MSKKKPQNLLNLLSLISDYKFTQKDIAEHTMYSENYVKSVISGNNIPSKEFISRVSTFVEEHMEKIKKKYMNPNDNEKVS